MLLQIVLWSLVDTEVTVAELRDLLRNESVDAFAGVPGLRFTAWISDEAGERWGAVYLWESAGAAEPPGRGGARELIGKAREGGGTFEVEATIEGLSDDEEPPRRGLAFE